MVNRPGQLPRRRLVQVLVGAGVAALAPGAARAATRQRVIALDWSAAETLFAINAPPIAIAEVDNYTTWTAHQPPPPSIVDVGLTTQPSLELMDSLRPDLILVADLQKGALEHRLRKVARIENVSIYNGDRFPLAGARRETLRLGQVLGAVDDAQALVDRAEAVFAAARARVAPYRERPVLCFVLQDERHGWVADRNGLVQNVLDELGLQNAWQGENSFWGFTMIGIEALAPYPDVLLLVGRFTLDDPQAVDRSPIWQALEPVRAGRAVDLPRFWYFGALPTAIDLAQRIADAVVTKHAA